MNSFVLLAQKIFNWYLHIIECDISGTCSRRVRSLDRFGFDTFASLDEDDRKSLVCRRISESCIPGKIEREKIPSLTCLNASYKIITEHSVGDPLL